MFLSEWNNAWVTASWAEGIFHFWQAVEEAQRIILGCWYHHFFTWRPSQPLLILWCWQSPGGYGYTCWVRATFKSQMKAPIEKRHYLRLGRSGTARKFPLFLEPQMHSSLLPLLAFLAAPYPRLVCELCGDRVESCLDCATSCFVFCLLNTSLWIQPDPDDRGEGYFQSIYYYE